MAYKKIKSNTTVHQTQTIKDYQTRQSLVQGTPYKVVVKDFSKEFDSIVEVTIGDWHIGSPDFDINEAIRVINYVLQTPNATLKIIGDMMNAAITSSVSDKYEDVNSPQDQWLVFKDLLSQVGLQGKIICNLGGNHPDRISKDTSMDPALLLAEATGTQDAFGTCYVENLYRIQCDTEPCGFYEIATVSHHGQGKDPEKLSQINAKSSLNTIGHLHNPQTWAKTVTLYDAERGCNVKREVIEVITPALAGGTYGDKNGYRPLYKSAYTALEITTTKNPRYKDFLDRPTKEEKTIVVTRALDIMNVADSKLKENCIKAVSKNIKKNFPSARIEFLNSLQECLSILENYGFYTSIDAQAAIAKQYKLESKRLEMLNSKTAKPKQTNTGKSENEDEKGL